MRVVAPLYKSNFLAEKSDVIPVTGIQYSGDIRGASRIVPRINFIFSHAFSTIYKPDIVHETYYSRNRTVNDYAKTVVTVYDTIEELYPEYFPKNKRTIEIRKAVFRRSDHLVCISESTRTDLIALYKIDPEKISVVHLASSLTVSAEPPVDIGHQFFLYVGNRGGYKNFLGLLAAFAESALYKTHKIICFGGGYRTRFEKERMEQLGIPNDRIVFVSGDDSLLARYYAAAQAFVYPSLYEGFGIPLLEAMECGCPVICSNSSSIPEVAGDAAIYFDVRDAHDVSNAMRKVTQSAEERLRLIEKGKVRIKQFSWDKCAQQTFAIYERLLAK